MKYSHSIDLIQKLETLVQTHLQEQILQQSAFVDIHKLGEAHGENNGKFDVIIDGKKCSLQNLESLIQQFERKYGTSFRTPLPEESIITKVWQEIFAIVKHPDIVSFAIGRTSHPAGKGIHHGMLNRHYDKYRCRLPPNPSESKEKSKIKEFAALGAPHDLLIGVFVATASQNYDQVHSFMNNLEQGVQQNANACRYVNEKYKHFGNSGATAGEVKWHLIYIACQVNSTKGKNQLFHFHFLKKKLMFSSFNFENPDCKCGTGENI